MKIAFIVEDFPKLSETFILNQITGLLDRGQEVDIYARRPSTQLKAHPDVKNYQLLEHTHYLSCPQNRQARFTKSMALLLKGFPQKPRVVLNSLNILQFGRKASSLTLLCQISPFLNQGPYDIVHCQYGPNGNLALLIKETGALQGKVITTFHGYDISTYLQRAGRHIYDHLFKTGDLFLCISQRMKRELLNLGCSEEKICVHRVGVDTNKFAFSTSELKSHGKTRLLTIARLVEKKGLRYAIQAVASLLKKFPHIEYTIIGDGPLRDELHNLITTLKAGAHIKLIGWMRQEEVIEWLYKSDILLAPSVTSQDGDQEGTPVVIIEALARGLPVLSTQHSGIPELIQDGQSGILVPERDVAAFADRLEFLIRNPEIWPEMGHKARSYVEEHHNIDKLNDQLVKIYQQLISGN
jgi:colanic acid/amylovoran biosynthesis glycosyltransferase